MSDPRIRAATDDDWPRIWPVFAAIVAAGETYAFPEDLTLETGRGWWMESPPALTVVLEEGGHLLGTAKMGPNRPGRGDHVGTASYVVDWHRAQGYAGIQFNAVVETNLAAVHLWQSAGFEIVGTVPAAFRSASQGPVGLHVMYLPL